MGDVRLIDHRGWLDGLLDWRQEIVVLVSVDHVVDDGEVARAIERHGGGSNVVVGMVGFERYVRQSKEAVLGA